LQRAFAATLIVEEKGLAFGQHSTTRHSAKHDVAGLEVAIEKIVATGTQQKFCEAAEVVFERLLVKGNAGEAEKVILEIIKIHAIDWRSKLPRG